MTSEQELRAELESVDEEIDKLSSRSTGFDFVAGVKRLRSVLLNRDERNEAAESQQLYSTHERAERIRELQRRREAILKQLAKESRDTPTEQPEEANETTDQTEDGRTIDS